MIHKEIIIKRQMEKSVLKIAIVDDEREMTDLVEGYVRKYAAQKGIAFQITVFHDGETFLTSYTADYDIVLLDIEFGNGLNGIEIARELRKMDESAVLMFITNMPQYAINGYEVNAVDYVLKPVNEVEFCVKLAKAMRFVRKNAEEKLLVHTVDGDVYFFTSDLYYVEVFKHYLIYHTASGDFRGRGTMKEAQERLERFAFARCHNCFLVNLKYVESLNGSEITVAGQKVQVSRSRKSEFMELFARYVGGI